MVHDNTTLLEAAQQGDQDAFGEIVRRHQGSVYGFLRARLLQGSDAEDLTQETFLRAYTSRARFDSAGLRTTGRPMATGYTPDGRLIIVVYEEIDDATVYPVTAFEVNS